MKVLRIVVASLLIGLASTASAQGPSYILPDQHFVETECRELMLDAEKHLPSALPRVQILCEQVETNEISPDEWMVALDPVAREIDQSIPCPMCLRFFLPERQPVPSEFSTYILALVPSPQLAENYEWVWRFRDKFDAFGGSIGESKAAIWLGERYGDSIDIDRSKYYCDIYELNYNDGPYVVITNRRPDLISDDDEIIIVKLGGISESGVLRVLNLLEQDLRKERDIRKRALLFEEVKQRLLSVAERHGDYLKEVVVSWLKK